MHITKLGSKTWILKPQWWFKILSEHLNVRNRDSSWKFPTHRSGGWRHEAVVCQRERQPYPSSDTPLLSEFLKNPKSPFLSLAPVESFTKSHTQFKFMLYLISIVVVSYCKTLLLFFGGGYASSFWFVVFWSSCDKFSIFMKLFPGYMPFHMEQYILSFGQL